MNRGMTEVINGKKYSTETAEVVASDCYWDGSNFERSGRNTYLYRTKKGNYFLLHLSQWTGERDGIDPIEKAEAKSIWDELSEKSLTYEEAFDVVPEEA